MGLELLTRTIAVSILASSLVVIVVMATRYTPSATVSNVEGDTGADPSAVEHRRCKELGLDATSDDTCRALWAKDHDHFFGLKRPHERRPANPTPAPPDPKGETAPAFPDGLDMSRPKSLESLDAK